VLSASVKLGERRVDRTSSCRAECEVGDRLALEQDRLSGELPHTIEFGLAQFVGRLRGNVGGICHGQRGKSQLASDPGRRWRAK
jgi:hypothetical protein